jgi:heme-degrading monooxygenase HmoA
VTDIEAGGTGETIDRTAAAAPVLLLTAWHLPRMRGMLRGFYNVRKLDFATRGWPGCRWVHRWISRRSLLLTTAWESWDEARDWLGSAEFRRTDLAIRGIDGTVVRIERYDNGVQIALDEVVHEARGPDA